MGLQQPLTSHIYTYISHWEWLMPVMGGVYLPTYYTFFITSIIKGKVEKIKLTFYWYPYLWSSPTWGRKESYLTTDSSFIFPLQKLQRKQVQHCKLKVTTRACLGMSPGTDASVVR